MSARATNVWEDYIEPNLNVIASLRQQGHTEKEIAEHLNIAYRTLIRYKEKNSQLRQVLKKSKKALVAELEQSLYRKALGGFDIKKTVTKWIEIDGVKGEAIEYQETVIEQAPDLGALIFALKNLAPDRWKDKQEINESVDELTKAVKGFLDGVANDSD